MCDHSSSPELAFGIKRPTRVPGRNKAPVAPLFGLAPGGVCHAAAVAGRAVRSCRTLSPLPAHGGRRRSALCGTFPGVTPAERYPAPSFPWSPDFPRCARTRNAAARPSDVVGNSACAALWEAVPAQSPTRPPISYWRWKVGWMSGPAPQADQSSPCGWGSSRASRIMRHSASTSPSTNSGRKRRWNAMIAAIGSLVS